VGRYYVGEHTEGITWEISWIDALWGGRRKQRPRGEDQAEKGKMGAEGGRDGATGRVWA
jgi:hypothetical protein